LDSKEFRARCGLQQECDWSQASSWAHFRIRTHILCWAFRQLFSKPL